MMSFPRSCTSPLPVFGIRNLTGPENPPGLISITSREYDSTIESEPSAKLLYLDEDDGELITVGSALELSQRLYEPVPRCMQSKFSEIRSPLDGKLVHVFDINRTPGSLMVWTDHEAYSSKGLPRTPFPSQTSPSPFADPIESVITLPLTLPKENIHLPEHDDESDGDLSTNLRNSTGKETQKDENVEIQATKILDGIEEHLNGLASVLQIAATTLEKAANKTRDTDTSVMEDILKGVKNILTEVGSFGLEAYKAFEDKSSEGPSWLNSISDKPLANKSTQEQTPLQAFVSQPEDLALDEAERAPTNPIPIADNRPSPRVKFAASVVDVVDEVFDPFVSPISSTLDESAESFSEKRKRDEMGECERIVPIADPSILDVETEDADFTARYPPLMSIRRAHTVSGLYGRENMRGSRRSEHENQSLQYKPASHQNICPPPSQNIDKPDNAEHLPKPIPGAWPNFKESSSALPTSGESSGAFFNRMTGRDRLRDVSTFGLHRANTTAASNPASRLSGPFDPISSYQSAELRSSEAPFRPRRAHVSSSRARYQPPWARSARDDFSPAGFRAWKDYIKEESELGLRSKRSMPALRYSSRPVFGEKSTSTAISDEKRIESSNSDHHRTVKHHRSVPQFHLAASKSPARNTVESWPWPQPSLDLLTGPALPLEAVPSSARSSEPHSFQLPNVQNFTNPLQSPLQIANPSRGMDPTQSRQPPQSSLPLGDTPYRFSLASSQSPVFSTSAAPFHPSMNEVESLAEESGPSSSDFYSTSSQSFRPFFEPEKSHAKPARPAKNKFDRCVDHLKILGFGTNDSMVRDRLHVYAVAADGDVTEAVEMIEEDRRVSGTFC